MIGKVTDKVTIWVTGKVTDNQMRILKLITNDKLTTTKELSEKVGISQRKIKENIRNLKESGRLIRLGSEKSGHWEIFEST